MHFCDLPTKVSQQTLKLLSQNISSFFNLLRSEKLSKIEKSRLNLPQYYSKKGLCPVIFTNQALYKKTFQQEGLLHLSGTDLKFKSKIIHTLEDFNQLLQQVRIIPFNKNHKGKELNDLQEDSPFIIEIVYKAKAKINTNQGCNLSVLSTQNKTTVSYQTKKGEAKLLKEKKVIEKILSLDLNQMQFASIDHNVDNLAIACYNGNSLLYSLKQLKSANHLWNKKTADLQSKIDNLKNELKWLKQNTQTFSLFQSIFDNKNLKSFLTEESYQILLKQQYQETVLFIQQTEIGIKKLINKRKRLTTKRNNFVENYSHQLSRQLINQLQQLGVNNIIYGKNVNFKKEINLGKVTNQNFVQIPFNKIIDKLKYKAILANMNFMTVEESYTSKTSFLDKEQLFSFKYKPTDEVKKQELQGKRFERSLFKTRKNHVIHADINGAYNIARKVIGESVYSIVNMTAIMGSCPSKFKIKLN